MTFNIRRGEGMDRQYDLARSAAVITSMGVDVAAIQEVDRAWSARSAFDDQPARLAALTGMRPCYGPNLTSAAGGEYGTLVLSRLPILECLNAPLPKADGREQRGVLQVVVDAGARLRVFNTHLGLDRTEREAQVRALAAIVASAGPGARILAGDMNTGPGTTAAGAELEPLRPLFTDAWVTVGVGPGYTIPPDAPRARIDMIFVAPPVTALAAQVVPTLVSDHLPVVVDVELRAP